MLRLGGDRAVGDAPPSAPAPPQRPPPAARAASRSAPPVPAGAPRQRGESCRPGLPPRPAPGSRPAPRRARPRPALGARRCRHTRNVGSPWPLDGVLSHVRERAVGTAALNQADCKAGDHRRFHVSLTLSAGPAWACWHSGAGVMVGDVCCGAGALQRSRGCPCRCRRTGVSKQQRKCGCARWGRPPAMQIECSHARSLTFAIIIRWSYS